MTDTPAPRPAFPFPSVSLYRRQYSGGLMPNLPPWLRSVLRVPLLVKLIGASLLVGVVLAGVVIHQTAGAIQDRLLMVLFASLGVSLVVNVLLVALALRPLNALEQTAERVWRGDFDARVPPSPLADRDMARLGSILNLLLDSLVHERRRMRDLAAQVIDAQDAERSRIARELHDSTAQTLTAVTLQLSAVARECEGVVAAERMEMVRSLAQSALEEVRMLAVSVYPRVLDDLGLPAALDWLSRQTHEEGHLEVIASIDVDGVRFSRSTASALYRVAQEALRNVQRHANATRAILSLHVEGDSAVLEVADDGTGFDLADAETRRPGMGLFAMRERLELVGGDATIDTAPGMGTTVRARVPLQRTEIS